MKILANAYEANFPNFKRVSQGGTANFSSLLSTFFAQNGHAWIGLSVKSSEKDGPPKLIYEDQEKTFWQMYVSFKKIKGAMRAPHGVNLKSAFQKEISSIERLLKKLRPDIVLLNGCYFKPWLILRAAAKIKIPIVALHAGVWTRELKRGASLYSKESLKSHIKSEADFSKLSNYEIFLNKWARRIYKKEVFNTPNGKTKIIPLPIPLGKPLPKKRKKLFGKFKIGIVARWDQIKNHQAVAGLAENCRKRGLKWKFYAVTRLKRGVEAEQEKKRYKKFIKVLKPRNKKALEKFYRKMDLTILPSHFDVSPHVVPESLFNGTPALISPNTGWTDYYEEAGGQDLIIDFGNIDKVIKRIKKIKNRPVPKKLTEIIKRKNSAETCLKQYLLFFNKVLKESKKTI